jgi:hypothetical protein
LYSKNFNNEVLEFFEVTSLWPYGEKAHTRDGEMDRKEVVPEEYFDLCDRCNVLGMFNVAGSVISQLHLWLLWHAYTLRSFHKTTSVLLHNITLNDARVSTLSQSPSTRLHCASSYANTYNNCCFVDHSEKQLRL